MKKQILCAIYAVTIATACHANLKLPSSFADDVAMVVNNYRLESKLFKDIAEKALQKDIKSILKDPKVVNIIEYICKHMLHDELKIDRKLLKKAFRLSAESKAFWYMKNPEVEIEDKMAESFLNSVSPATKQAYKLAQMESFAMALAPVFYSKYVPVVGTYFSHMFKETSLVVSFNNFAGVNFFKDLKEVEVNDAMIQDELIEDDAFMQNLYARALSDIKNIDPEIIYEINTLDAETKFIVRVAVYRLTLFAMTAFIFDHFDSTISQDILKYFYGTDEPIERN
jgi:hypothetical protein